LFLFEIWIKRFWRLSSLKISIDRKRAVECGEQVFEDEMVMKRKNLVVTGFHWKEHEHEEEDMEEEDMEEEEALVDSPSHDIYSWVPWVMSLVTPKVGRMIEVKVPCLGPADNKIATNFKHLWQPVCCLLSDGSRTGTKQIQRESFSSKVEKDRQEIWKSFWTRRKVLTREISDCAECQSPGGATLTTWEKNSFCHGSFREALGSEETDWLARGGTRERRGRGERRGGGLLEEGWAGLGWAFCDHKI
jgi:hypothetical protein